MKATFVFISQMNTTFEQSTRFGHFLIPMFVQTEYCHGFWQLLANRGLASKLVRALLQDELAIELMLGTG